VFVALTGSSQNIFMPHKFNLAQIVFICTVAKSQIATKTSTKTFAQKKNKDWSMPLSGKETWIQGLGLPHACVKQQNGRHGFRFFGYILALLQILFECH